MDQSAATLPLKPKDYRSALKPVWCPGCGDFAVLNAITKALAFMELPREQVALITGIGCSSRIAAYTGVYGFHGVHGRALALASGLRAARPDMKVLVAGGDGDGLSIGGNHFIHTMRRNINITHIAQNNQVYGLTKGQYSPTSQKGYKSKTSPYGAIEPPINPMTHALAGEASFVSRTFAGDREHMVRIFKEAIQHRGYALVDVLQPCIIFNRVNTYEWYGARVYDVEEDGHDRRDKSAAWRLAQLWGEKIPIGVLYQEERPTYEDQEVALRNGSLVKQELKLLNPVQVEKLKALFL